jgi:hypothetical protein
MGIWNAVLTYGKARMIGRLLRRGVGGKVGTALLVAYMGKKAYDHFRAGQRVRVKS